MDGRLTARQTRIVLMALVVLAAVLRALRLDATEPWLDEACTAWYAALPVGRLLAGIASETHPPLYYLMVKGVTAVLGFDPVALRLLSFVAGVLWVPAAWLVGRRWVGPAGALVGAAALAVHPLAIHYAVEARPYAVAILLSLVALDRWDAWLSEGRRRNAFAWCALSVCAFLSHHFAGPPVLSTALLAWWVRRGVRVTRRHDLCGLALPTVAALAPFAPILSGHLGGPSLDWIGRYWEGPLAALAGTAQAFGGSGPFPDYLGPLAFLGAPSVLGAVAMVAAWVLAALGLWERFRIGPRAVAPLGAQLVVPVLVPLSVSLVLRPLYLAGRYEVFALPAFCLAAGAGVATVVRLLRWPARVAGAAWLVAIGVALSPWLASEFEKPSLAFHDLLGRQHDRVDGVLAVGFAFAPILYQDRVVPAGVPILPVPAALGEHPGWYDLALPVDRDEVAPVPAGSGDVWLLSLPGDGFAKWTAEQAARIVATGRRPDRTLRIGEMVLRVFRPPGLGAAPAPPSPRVLSAR